MKIHKIFPHLLELLLSAGFHSQMVMSRHIETLAGKFRQDQVFWLLLLLPSPSIFPIKSLLPLHTSWPSVVNC